MKAISTHQTGLGIYVLLVSRRVLRLISRLIEGLRRAGLTFRQRAIQDQGGRIADCVRQPFREFSNRHAV